MSRVVNVCYVPVCSHVCHLTNPTQAGRSCTKEAADFARAWVDTAARLPGVVAAQVGRSSEDGQVETSADGSGGGGADDATLGSGTAESLRTLFLAAIKAQGGSCAAQAQS